MIYPSVTVITPYYNNAETIISSIDSILKQTYEKIQYVLIDDGSKDFDYEKINKHIERNKGNNLYDYLIIKNERNLGTVKALNKGLSVAKSEYIFTLAADDVFFDSNVLKDWVDEFLKTGAQVITAKRAVYDRTMSEFKYNAPSEEHISLIKECSPMELFEALAGCNFVFSCCTAYSKKCYNAIGYLDERYRLVDDYPMNLKLLRKGVQFHFLDRVVIKYRLGGVSNIGNIDRAYLKDADKMFLHESFPYVKHKIKAIKAYWSWRSKTLALYDSNRYKDKYSSKKRKCGRFSYLFFMTIRHPVFMLKKLKRGK